MIKLENPHYKPHNGLIINRLIKSHKLIVPYYPDNTGHTGQYTYLYSGYNDQFGNQVWVLESPRDRGQL